MWEKNLGNISRSESRALFASLPLRSLTSNCLPNNANRSASIKELRFTSEASRRACCCCAGWRCENVAVNGNGVNSQDRISEFHEEFLFHFQSFGVVKCGDENQYVTICKQFALSLINSFLLDPLCVFTRKKKKRTIDGEKNLTSFAFRLWLPKQHFSRVYLSHQTDEMFAIRHQTLTFLLHPAQCLDENDSDGAIDTIDLSRKTKMTRAPRFN
jgi:hypothetical protein